MIQKKKTDAAKAGWDETRHRRIAAQLKRKLELAQTPTPPAETATTANSVGQMPEPKPMPKPAREKCRRFLAFVRTFPCVACGKPATAHHLHTVGAGGSDFSAVPLCPEHHFVGLACVHALGVDRFNAKYGVDLWESNRRLLAAFNAQPLGRRVKR